MRYLLDTNIISQLVRDPQGTVARRVEGLEEGELETSIIVAAELKFGVARRGSQRLARLVGETLASFRIHAWDKPADDAYAALRTALERQGQRIGQNDMLIAAHAVALESTLVTDNEGEFARVPGLEIENWLRG